MANNRILYISNSDQMRKFLLYSLYFFLIAALLISSTSLITYLLAQNRLDNIRVPEDINVIICGDSHTQTAIDDKIYPRAINISQSSQHYFYLYSVLNKILENNPQIDTVIVGFSYHSLSEFYDDYLFEEEFSKHMYTRYFSILDLHSIGFLFFKNFSGIANDFNNIFKSVKKNLKEKDLKDYQFIGKFYDSDRTNKNDSTVMRAINTHFFQDDGSKQGFSDYQLFYLERIIQLCRENGIRLYLVNCPISQDYRSKIPHKFINNYNVFWQEHRELILDYNDFPLPEDHFGDGDHINVYGARIFTEFLKKQLGKQSVN